MTYWIMIVYALRYADVCDALWSTSTAPNVCAVIYKLKTMRRKIEAIFLVAAFVFFTFQMENL